MGIKEGTCQDEHWVLYISDESLNSTPEIMKESKKEGEGETERKERKEGRQFNFYIVRDLPFDSINFQLVHYGQGTTI